MNNVINNPNSQAWLMFLSTMICMWAIFFFGGTTLLGGFGQPRTKIFVRPIIVLLWLGALELQGRVYRAMLYQHRNGPDPFLRVMLPVQIIVLLALVIRAARLVDRARNAQRHSTGESPTPQS
jgi:hypothetical protein